MAFIKTKLKTKFYSNINYFYQYIILFDNMIGNIFLVKFTATLLIYIDSLIIILLYITIEIVINHK